MMKKKNALWIAMAALMAGGVTFGGFKIKDKKEKEEIEKQLKEILIPDAERKLDSLQQEHESTIASYEEQMAKLGLLEEQQDSLDQAFVRDEQVKQVARLFSELSGQWNSKVHDLVYKDLNLHPWGEDGCILGWEEAENEESLLPVSKDKKVNDLYQKLYYLTGNKAGPTEIPRVPVTTGKTLLQDSLYIPSMTSRTYHEGIHSDWYTGEAEYYSGWDAEKEKKGYYTNDVDLFLWIMNSYAIPTMVDTIHPDWVGDGKVMYPKDDSPEYAISVLDAIQGFLDGIDNSGKAFDEKTLSDLQKAVKVLKTALEKQISISKNVSKTKGKANTYKKASDNLKKQIKKQGEKLGELKSPGVVEAMRRAQRKGSR